MTAPVTGVFLASMPWVCRRAAVRLPQQVCTQRLALPFMLNQSPSSCVSESICSQCRLTILLQRPLELELQQKVALILADGVLIQNQKV